MPTIIRISARLGSVITASSRLRQSGSSVTTRRCAVASVTLRRARNRHADHAAVQLAQQVGDVGGDRSMTLRAAPPGRQADRFAHRLLGPFGVAAAQLRQAADVGRGVVDALGRSTRRGRSRRPGGARRPAAPARARCPAPACRSHRRRGAEVGRRRHRSDMAGIQDVGAGAGRARALGATKTATGTGDARMSLMMLRIEYRARPACRSAAPAAGPAHERRGRANGSRIRRSPARSRRRCAARTRAPRRYSPPREQWRVVSTSAYSHQSLRFTTAPSQRLRA